jgi:adenine phosphoribosyltransferase
MYDCGMTHPLEKFIRNVQDFPKPGVGFKDITPLMEDHLPELIKSMSQNIDWSQIDYVVGIESRGFILGAAMAMLNNKGFIVIRKKGKLPPPVVAESYALEYGTDTIEMAVNTQKKRILLVDDVLATGGTLNAAIKLCQKNHLQVMGSSVFINLSFLNNFESSGQKLHAVLTY